MRAMINGIERVSSRVTEFSETAVFWVFNVFFSEKNVVADRFFSFDVFFGSSGTR